MDHLGVRQPVLPGAGSDPRDPQAAELPLAVTPIPIRVLTGVEQLLLGHAVPTRARGIVALRLAQDLPALLLRVDRTFDSRHLRLLPEQPSDVRALGRDLGHALDPAPSAAAFLRQEVVAGGLAVKNLPRSRDPEPLRRRPVRLLPHGLELSSFYWGPVPQTTASRAAARPRFPGPAAAPARPGVPPPRRALGSGTVSSAPVRGRPPVRSPRPPIRGPASEPRPCAPQPSSSARSPSPCCGRPAWAAPPRRPCRRGPPPTGPRSCARDRCGPSRARGT